MISTDKGSSAAGDLFKFKFTRSADKSTAVANVTSLAQDPNKKTQVVFVLDVSGSMTCVLPMVKSVVLKTCEQMKHAKVGIVVFNHKAQAITPWLIDVEESETVSVLEKKLENIEANGNTNLWDGMHLGFALFETSKVFKPPNATSTSAHYGNATVNTAWPAPDSSPEIPNTTNPNRKTPNKTTSPETLNDYTRASADKNVMVLITDGEPTHGECRRDIIRNRCRSLTESSRVTLFSMALGNHCDLDLLTSLGQNFIQTPDTLAAVLKSSTELAGEVSNIAFGACTLEFKYPGTHRIFKIDITRFGVEQTKRFVMAPPMANAKEDGTGFARMVDLDGRVLHREPLFLIDSYTEDDALVHRESIRERLVEILREMYENKNYNGSAHRELKNKLNNFIERMIPGPVAQRALLVLHNPFDLVVLHTIYHELKTQDHQILAPFENRTKKYQQDLLHQTPVFLNGKQNPNHQENDDDNDDLPPPPPPLYRTVSARQTSEQIMAAVQDHLDMFDALAADSSTGSAGESKKKATENIVHTSGPLGLHRTDKYDGKSDEEGKQEENEEIFWKLPPKPCLMRH